MENLSNVYHQISCTCIVYVTQYAYARYLGVLCATDSYDKGAEVKSNTTVAFRWRAAGSGGRANPQTAQEESTYFLERYNIDMANKESHEEQDPT